MKKNTRILALTGICGALAMVCALGVAYLNWVALALSVICATAVAIPTMVDSRYVWYSVLCYVAVTILIVWLGFGQPIRVMPLVVYALPVGIVKAFGESYRPVKRDSAEEFFDKPKQRIPKLVRWILYYVLCEVALAVTALMLYLFVPATLQTLIDKQWHWYILVVAQLAVPLYNIVLNGCFVLARRTTTRYFDKD